MPTLPASYSLGVVVFNALISLGDIDGNGLIDPKQVNGTIRFDPEVSTYRSATYPSVLVGNATIESNVVNGELRSKSGAVGERIPTGRWHATFDLPGMTIPGAVIDVESIHTEASPLDLGAQIQLPMASSQIEDMENAEATSMVIVDNGDGGFTIIGQEFVDSTGRIRSISITENADGSIDLDLGTV